MGKEKERRAECGQEVRWSRGREAGSSNPIVFMSGMLADPWGLTLKCQKTWEELSLAIDNQQKYSVISDFLSLKGPAPFLESSYLLPSINSGLKIWVQCTSRI